MNEDAKVEQATSPAERERTERETPRMLSPELALVDPELAARARAELTREADRNARMQARPNVLAVAGWTPARGSSTTSPSPEPVRPSLPAMEPSLQRGRLLRRSVLTLAAAAVLLAAIALTPRAPSEGPILVDVRAQEVASAATEGRGDAGRRTFLWPSLRNVRGYEFVLVREARKVLVARTREARLTVAPVWTYRGRRFAFERGSYRWYVWPVARHGAIRRDAKPIVDARFVVAA